MLVNNIKCGIYKIKTLHNNEFYIGSSVYLKGRISDHFTRLKANKHSNIHLQRIYNKYGKENFEIEYVINCPKEYLIKLEQWFIDNQKPYYNMQKIAGGNCLGIKRSKLTCLKISNSLKGKKLSSEHKRNLTISKKNFKGKIYQYDINNNLIKIWNINIVDIAKKLNFKKNSIMDVLSKKRNSIFGNVFKYEKEVNNA